MRILAVVRFSPIARTVETVPHIDAAAAPATVGDLTYDRHIILVHGAAELFEIGNDPVVEEFDAIPVTGSTGRVHAG
jgi:hypothetical protein